MCFTTWLINGRLKVCKESVNGRNTKVFPAYPRHPRYTWIRDTLILFVNTNGIKHFSR